MFRGVVTGKPVEIGGSSGRNPATGKGVYYTIQNTLEHLRMKMPGLRVAVQGFGNAGSGTAHMLDTAQAYVIAVSDSKGCIHNNNGLDIPKLILHKQKTGTVIGFRESEEITPEELLSLKCDVLIPAALENTITLDNANRVKARIIAEAANGPCTPDADKILDNKDTFVIPDVLCNAGGVTVSYLEWVQDEQHLFWEEKDIFEKLESIMTHAFSQVLKVSLEKKMPMRIAANMVGISRVAEVIRLRGFYP